MSKYLKVGIPWLIVIILFIFVPQVRPTSIVGIVIFVALLTYSFITLRQLDKYGGSDYEKMQNQRKDKTE